MRKTGTFSAAAGLIFLGIWMLIYRENATLGDKIIKFWPIIIIVLGLEVLLFSKGKEGGKLNFNFLVIPIVLVFLFVNLFSSLGKGILKGIKLLENRGSIGTLIDNFDKNLYDEKNLTKMVESTGNKINIDGNNLQIEFRKSSGKNIELSAKIFLDKGWDKTSQLINEVENKEGNTFSFENDNIRKVVLILSIPDGHSINVTGDNLDIKNSEKFLDSSLSVKGNNGNLNITSFNSLKVELDNGNHNISDVNDIYMKMNNSKTTITGKAEKIIISSNNGDISINNKISKNIDIQAGNGVINFITEDKNLKIDAQVNQGACYVNSIKEINAGIEHTYGTGQGTVKLRVDSGVIKVNSQE
ncbi:MAG TPA: hypothetical protein VIK72_05835 [Clostridiaceae bacterium]